MQGAKGGQLAGKVQGGQLADKVQGAEGGQLAGKVQGGQGGQLAGKLQGAQGGQLAGKLQGAQGGQFAGKLQGDNQGRLGENFSPQRNQAVANHNNIGTNGVKTTRESCPISKRIEQGLEWDQQFSEQPELGEQF